MDILTRVGDPLPQILGELCDRSTDLAVLGAHGRHVMRDRLLGTMAESVVRSAACPVLVVRTMPAIAIDGFSCQLTSPRHPGRRLCLSIASYSERSY